MKSLLDFWKKDIINKLIVIASLALAGGVFGFGWLIFNMPQGKSFSQAFESILPKQATPTFDISIYLTPGASVPVASTSTVAAFYLPTFTPQPPTPMVELPTVTLEVLPTLALELPTQPLDLSAQSVPAGADCIPNTPRQTGKVVEVLDGNTVRVLLKDTGLVYVIRYIGVSAPKDKVFGDTAKLKNSQLVYGQSKEVTLIQDKVEKDDRGRLLRYVLLGNTFINMELVKQGYDAALDVPPGLACAQAFKQAEQSASAALIGIWSPTATPKKP